MWYSFLIDPYSGTVRLVWFDTKMELVVSQQNKTMILINYFLFRLQKEIERWKRTNNVFLHICIREG